MIEGLGGYSAYRASGVDWVAQVPTHWRTLTNHRIFRETTRPYQGGTEVQLSLSQRQGLVPKDLMAEHSMQTASYDNWKIVLPGDVVCNRFKAHLGVFFAATRRGIVTFHYGVFCPKVAVVPKYFELLFHTPAYCGIYAGRSNGMTVGLQNLSNQNFYAVPSLVPPLDEQAAIVRFLDHADRRIRKYIRAKQQLIKLLDEQKRAIIHRAVTRGLDPNVRLKPSGVDWLGEVPEHWVVSRLKWVTRLQRGFDLPADLRVPGPYPVVSSGGFIGTHSEARCSGPGVVMGRYGSTEAVFYVESDFWPHNTSLFVTRFHGNDTKWCYYLLRSINKADHTGKSAVPGVDRKDLFDIVVAVPPVAEQAEIVHAVQVQTSNVSHAVEVAHRELALLREYRTRLFSDVLTGQLDVRAAATALPDEPTDAEPLDEADAGDEDNLDATDATPEADQE